MRALSYGAARFLLRRPRRAVGIPRHATPVRLVGAGLSPRVSARYRSLSSISGEGTIYALSTAAGRAAIAVIRISGPACAEIYRVLCPGHPLPKPRYAALRALYGPPHSPAKSTLLDSNALVLYFPAPKSVTGEDVLELHVHGGPAVVKAVLAAISRCTTAAESHSIRHAEPGEFTRRAFMNDRLDLTQVEALGDTLSATTEQQRRLSVRGTTSNLGKRYEAWRQQLLNARGELEALIDFSEDQHFDESPTQLVTSVASQVDELRRQVKAYSTNAIRGELLRNGINISLLGAPNAGKSSLLNLIVGREAAIVSREAGTTRDIVEVGLDIGGWYCQLGDMAGLRSGSKISAFQATGTENNAVGEVEQEGIRRAKQRALDSDILIIVFSVEPHLSGSGYHLPIDSSVHHAAIQALASDPPKNALVVINKTDLLSPDSSNAHTYTSSILSALPSLQPNDIFPISCKHASDTEGEDPGRIQAFLGGLVRKFEEITAPVSPEGDADPSVWQEALGATERQRVLLEKCLWHLDEFVEVASPTHPQPGDGGEGDEGGDVDIVLAAESLRSAAECLARITGRGEAGDVEEVLGVIFEKWVVLPRV
ncbi:MAG: mitochondrial splicing system protein [Geoglossum umbratile]|nr:MAG: mitochondrial splicing system protein [Geoglossum umbratile]